MPRSLNTSALMKPLVVLALPGMYLFYKYNQYKRQQQEQDRRKVTERELAHLNHKINRKYQQGTGGGPSSGCVPSQEEMTIMEMLPQQFNKDESAFDDDAEEVDKLLCKLEENEPEMATSQEDECVICVNARATMQTYPCGHRVVCRKCFVKTIQMAVSQRLLPLRCVICRSKILRLKQSSNGRSGSGVSASGSILMPTSASQYSMMSPGSSHPNQWAVPNSASLFSMTSGSSSFSGMSSVSSATTSSQGSGKSLLSSSSVGIKSGPGKLGYRQPTGALKKSQTQSMKLRVQEIKEPRLNSAGTSGASTSQGASHKERASSPSSSNGKCSGNQANAPASAPPRLPPIKEFQRDYRASKERASRDKATSASTRIRCAQKIVTQLEASPSIASCPPPHSTKKAVASTSHFRTHSPVKLGKKEKRKEEKKRLKEEKKKAGEGEAAASAAAREKEKEAKVKKEESGENAKGKKKEEKQGKKEKKEGKKD